MAFNKIQLLAPGPYFLLMMQRKACARQNQTQKYQLRTKNVEINYNRF